MYRNVGDSMYRLVLIALCYIVGALPTSYYLVWLKTKKDLRTLGSGNSGATNAARVLGPSAFFSIVCIDALKAYGILWFSQAQGLESWWLLGAAAAVMLGNSYSVFLSFSGGKGVATGLGVLLFLFPPLVVLGYCVVFMLVLMRMKRVDVASLSSALFGVVGVVLAGCSFSFILVAVAIAVWIWIRHWKNLYTLLKG
jgi:glycerol-3-phosphate acyltransferase PlsY